MFRELVICGLNRNPTQRVKAPQERTMMDDLSDMWQCLWRHVELDLELQAFDQLLIPPVEDISIRTKINTAIANLRDE